MKSDQKCDYDRVRCIDGVSRYYKKCIGFCNNRIHKGFLTVKLYKEHECFKRKCTFFDAKENHPYILEQAQKQKAKKEKRENRSKERSIIKIANDLFPSNIKPVYCKHLYDSTFFLAIYSTAYCDFYEILNILRLNSEFNIYIKFISKRQVANIEYTYMSLLPENIREKAEKYKRKR